MSTNRIICSLLSSCRGFWLERTCPKFNAANTVFRNYSQAVDLQPKEVEDEPDKLYKIIELEVRCNEPSVLKSYGFFVDYAAKKLGIEVGKTWTPKKAHHDRFTLLRSIHVNKKCRVQYETRTYFRFMQFHRLTGSTADTFLEYIQRNLPEGVAMKVTKVALEKIPDYIKPPES